MFAEAPEPAGGTAEGSADLVLDEATAMFDPEGEAEFIEACREVFRDRTVILVTHRPASLAIAATIHRLEEGRLRRIA